jgi:hypothetical protein
MEFTLLGSVAVAVLIMYGVLWFEGGRTNAADCTRDVWDALISAAVVGVVIGRLIAMISAGTNPVAHPGDILIVRAGVDTIAASMSALATYVILTRNDPWWLADAAAPAAIAGLAGWHGGCVVRDACLGTPSDLPWAVAQAGSVVTRHPVEIYTALLLLVTAGLLVWWKRHRPRPGVIASIAVAAAATARLMTEPLRLGLGGNLVGWYSIAAVAALSVAALRLRRSNQINGPQDPPTGWPPQIGKRKTRPGRRRRPSGYVEPISQGSAWNGRRTGATARFGLRRLSGFTRLGLERAVLHSASHDVAHRLAARDWGT